MLMILVFHILNRGGVLKYNPQEIVHQTYYAFYILDALCIVAVNCFVITAGYFYSKTFKLKKIISLYFTVLSYSLAFALIFSLLGHDVDWIRDVFLISTNRYWFVTTFVGLMLVSPFLAHGVDVVVEKDFRLILIIFGFFTGITPLLFKEDIFVAYNGYSLVWFIYLYLVGAYIKRTEISMRKEVSLFLYAGLSFLTVYLVYLMQDKMFLRYNAITVLLSSIFLFLFFKEVRIKHTLLTKIILFLSSNSLAVYVIQDDPYFRAVQNGMFGFILEKPVLQGNTMIVGIALIAFLIAVLINYTKTKIWRFIINVTNRTKEIFGQKRESETN